MNTVNKTQLMNLLAQEIGVGADDIRERRLRTLILIGKGMFWTGGYDKAAERLAADIQAEFDGIYNVAMEDEENENYRKGQAIQSMYDEEKEENEEPSVTNPPDPPPLELLPILEKWAKVGGVIITAKNGLQECSLFLDRAQIKQIVEDN